MQHVMIDLETWGTRPGSALRSLGAVVFDPRDGTLGSTFYRNIDDASCEALGLRKDPSTVAWWGEQSKSAQDALLADRMPLPTVLGEFSAWWRDVRGEWVWGHGASFDPVLLEAAYEACMLDATWKFWNIRCCRTILGCANRKPMRSARDTPHYALDDAIAQAKAVAAAFRHQQFTAA